MNGSIVAKNMTSTSKTIVDYYTDGSPIYRQFYELNNTTANTDYLLDGNIKTNTHMLIKTVGSSYIKGYQNFVFGQNTNSGGNYGSIYVTAGGLYYRQGWSSPVSVRAYVYYIERNL